MKRMTMHVGSAGRVIVEDGRDAPCGRVGCERRADYSGVGVCMKHYQQLHRGYRPRTTMPCVRCGKGTWGGGMCAKCTTRKPDPVCLLCGEAFKRKSGSDKFCSVEHRQSYRKRTPDQNHDHNHKRRAAKYGACYERFSAVDIFERDGWRCGICGRKVKPSRFPRDPEGPSLDHIIPLALGGPHARANCRLTHLRCNSARGVRGDVQLVLLG